MNKNVKVILVWFRNDLRIHDNEVLYSAIGKSNFIIPVYIFDPRYYSKNEFNFLRTGNLRKNFIQDSVLSLKNKLKSIGGDLLTFEGFPEQIIPQLVQKYDVDEVYHHREIAKRETDISEAVETALWGIKINLKHFIGHTLFHKEDFPFPIRDIPNDFNQFKKRIKKESTVRPAFPEVKKIQIPPHLEQTPISKTHEPNEITVSEEAALKELKSLVSKTKEDGDAYSKISPYIAMGILSPIFTYHYLKKHINKHNKKRIQIILDNLFKRDYFRFMVKKNAACYFINKNANDYQQLDVVQKWTQGETENQKVNKIMEKLNTEGILTSIEQEYTALYFIYELKQNWLIGAAWFEQQLIDYAPTTIYGNWAHYANSGTSIKNNKTRDHWVIQSQKTLYNKSF